MNESDAISRLKQGDIAGLDSLMLAHQVEAIRTAFLVIHDRTLAEDIVQDAFLRVYERIRQFDGTRPFRPWLMRIVVNDAVKVATRRRRDLSLDYRPAPDGDPLADLLEDGRPGPADVAEQEELNRMVASALERLTPQQRAVVVLRYYLGLTDAEAAQDLRVARGTVKRRLHEAKNRLRVLLGGKERHAVDSGSVGSGKEGGA
ncbi:MAG: RNA polymerase sigma factor [Dehalococcoidia bacterium]